MSVPLHSATPKDAQRVVNQIQQQRILETELQTAQNDLRLAHAKVRRLERVIAQVLSTSALPEATRETLVGLLAGTRTGAIDPQVSLSAPAEQRLIANVRALSGTNKQLVTRVAKELAALEALRRKGKKGRA